MLHFDSSLIVQFSDRVMRMHRVVLMGSKYDALISTELVDTTKTACAWPVNVASVCMHSPISYNACRPCR